MKKYKVRVTVKAVQEYDITASSERNALNIAENLSTKDGYRGFDILDFDTEIIS